MCCTQPLFSERFAFFCTATSSWKYLNYSEWMEVSSIERDSSPWKLRTWRRDLFWPCLSNKARDGQTRQNQLLETKKQISYTLNVAGGCDTFITLEVVLVKLVTSLMSIKNQHKRSPLPFQCFCPIKNTVSPFLLTLSVWELGTLIVLVL